MLFTLGCTVDKPQIAGSDPGGLSKTFYVERQEDIEGFGFPKLVLKGRGRRRVKE